MLDIRINRLYYGSVADWNFYFGVSCFLTLNCIFFFLSTTLFWNLQIIMKHFFFLWKSVKGSSALAGCFSDGIKEWCIHTTSAVALEFYLLLRDWLFFEIPHWHAIASTLLLRYFSVLTSPVMPTDRPARRRNVIPEVCFDTLNAQNVLDGAAWPLYPFYCNSAEHYSQFSSGLVQFPLLCQWPRPWVKQCPHLWETVRDKHLTKLGDKIFNYVPFSRWQKTNGYLVYLLDNGGTLI